MRKVIVNPTPIIGLANIGKLDLLHKVYGQIIIPQAVYNELISPSVKNRYRKTKTGFVWNRFRIPRRNKCIGPSSTPVKWKS